MTRHGCFAWCCALLVVVAACSMDGNAASGGAEVATQTAASIPTPETATEGNEASAGNSSTPTPTAEHEEDGAAASGSNDNTLIPNDIVQMVSKALSEGAVSSYVDERWSVPASLDEQIIVSDVIARATLKSATSTTEKISGKVVRGYRAVHELRFTVHEYLKGSGPSEALIVARSENTYSTVAKAQEVADSTLSRRTTTWDDRQGVLFLKALDGSSFVRARYASTAAVGSSVGATTTTAFAINARADESWWEHTVDTNSRGWLPAEKAASSGSSDGASGAASVSFATGGSGFITNDSMASSQTVTLGDLKTRIAQMATTLKAGESIPGYRECIYSKIRSERHFRAIPYTPIQFKASLTSGSAAGTEVYRRLDTDEPKYLRFYVTGLDKDYFQAPNIDDDSDPSNGYFTTLSTTRPLPSGRYSVKYHSQDYVYIPCNFKPDDTNYFDWKITVTAPSGTVHEAFFDPASTFLGGGASGGAGVISPARRRRGDHHDQRRRGDHHDHAFGSMVSMQISPSVSLSGKHVEFIKVDGTVAARLSFDKGDLKGGIGIGGASAGNGTSTAESGVPAEAQAEIAAAMAEAQAAGSKMYFWFVSSAPWHAGDKLMMRIR